MSFQCRRIAVLLGLGLLSGCALKDSRIATGAQQRLIGIDELDLETCLGVPDQKASYEDTDVLTWYTTSSSSVSYSLPLIQGPSLSNGGNCHATVRFDHRIATHVVYTGEKNSLFAPSSYCAPIVRTCMAMLDQLHRENGAVAPAAPMPPGPVSR